MLREAGGGVGGDSDAPALHVRENWSGGVDLQSGTFS